LLDCKEEGCRALRDEAPQILDYLDEDCKKHFMKVLEYLDEVNLPYMVNPYIVRGLDYYTRTIFEFWSGDDENGKSALGGGGRYDGLVEILGGREATPACGLAIGIDRVVSKMRENNIAVPEDQYDIFVAQLGEPAKKKAMALYERLRRLPDVRPAQAFYKDNLKSQLEIANKLKVKFTLILGQKEMGDGTILLRDMDGGIQEVIDFNKTEEEIKIRIEKHRKTKIVSLGVDGEDEHLDKKLRRKHQEEDGMQENDQENEIIEAEERYDGDMSGGDSDSF
jgi:histidyl-tRNA synthetase